MARQLAEELKLEGSPSLDWVLEQPGVISREAEPTLSAEEAWPAPRAGAESRAR